VSLERDAVSLALLFDEAFNCAVLCVFSMFNYFIMSFSCPVYESFLNTLYPLVMWYYGAESCLKEVSSNLDHALLSPPHLQLCSNLSTPHLQ
jgi:hypothetical protein